MSTLEAATTYRDAIRSALADAMREDENVLVLGEDVGDAGGVFKVTEGLLEEFGSHRVMDTPISETGFIGASIGLALAGYRPVAELMFADFAGVAWDQLVNEAAKYLYMSNGQMNVPMVVRAGGGGGLRFASQHSQTTEAWYLGIPGLKVVAPSNPADAYGLMLAAIRDPNPVLYLEHKALYGTAGDFEADGRSIPIGSARIARSGADVTVVASLAMVSVALNAARLLADDRIEAEVVDLRSIVPLDLETVAASVERTSRLVTVEEEPVVGGWGSDLVAEIVARSFDSLDAPPLRIGTPFAPIGFSPVLEDSAIPTPDAVAQATARMVRGG